MLLQDTAPFLLYLLFIFTPIPAHLCKVTFDIPEAYLDPCQLPKKELFVKIVKSFQPITIFVKSFILHFVWVLHVLLCSEHLCDLCLPEIKTQS